MQAKELNDLILDVYDTTVAPQKWPETLEKVAHFLGARGAFLFELDRGGEDCWIRATHFSKSYDADLVNEYLATHNDQEVIDQEIFLKLSRSADDIELIPDEVLAGSEAELLARPNVQKMLQYKIRYRAGALLNKDLVDRDRFALQFSEKDGPLNSERMRRASLILPHIAKSLDVSRPTKQLADTFQSVANSLDHLLVGVCILDREGRIVHLNQEFQRQIAAYPIYKKDLSGRLILTSSQGDKALSRLRESLDNHGRFGARPRKEAVTLLLNGKPHTLCIEAAPLTDADEFGESKLHGHIVYSMDTGKFYSIDPAIMKTLFMLTAAEAEILALLAEGLTNSQISEQRGKSVETINTQVKSILGKTQSGNRTQLIRLAANISSSFISCSHSSAG